jgi:hypothetical protein
MVFTVRYRPSPHKRSVDPGSRTTTRRHRDPAAPSPLGAFVRRGRARVTPQEVGVAGRPAALRLHHLHAAPTSRPELVCAAADERSLMALAGFVAETGDRQ